MSFMKKMLAVSLAGALLVGFSGCNSADTSWVAEYNGVKIPAGAYISMMMDKYSVAQSKAPEGTKDVLKVDIEDVDATTWIKDQSLKALDEFIAIEQKYAEMGLVMTDNEITQAKTVTDMQWQYLADLYTKNGISQDSMKALADNSVKYNALLFATYGKDGTQAVPAAEIETYYKENYAVINYIATTKVDDIGQLFAPEDLAKDKEKLEGYLARAEKGESFNDLILENEKLANPNGESTHPHVDENSHDTVITKVPTKFPAKFTEEVFKAEIGKPFFFEDDTLCFVAVKKDPMANPAFITNYTNSIIYELKQEDFKAIVEGWSKDITATYNDAALQLYMPNKLKMK